MNRFKKIVLSLAAVAPTLAVAQSPILSGPALKDAFAGKFLIGVALNQAQSSGLKAHDAALAKYHFNSVVPENVMKCAEIHPEENRYYWDDADRFVQFGLDNDMFIIGHCLIWHSQLAPWFCVDNDGKLVSADVLKQRMRDHIYTVVGRYKGKVKGWDVVNEAIVEDGSYRKSMFYQILGEEFIPLAFQYAHEADPDAELYYNDYGMNVKGRRETVVKMVNDIKRRGLRIDGIGMQSHIGMDYPDFDEFETSLKAFAATGCNVMITELDMSALPTVNMGANVADMSKFEEKYNPYPNGLSPEVEKMWNDRMYEFFSLLSRNSDVISRVTAWGLTDGDSWKNDWPMHGRTDYPLLFDRNYQPKPVVKRLLNSNAVSQR